MKIRTTGSTSKESLTKWLMGMVLALAVGGWAGPTIILSEHTDDACSPSQSFQNVQNPNNPGSLFAAQAWGLHQADQTYESADDDQGQGKLTPEPNYLFIANASALVWRSDVTSNWERGGPAGKLAWLAEQNGPNGGQFSLMVGEGPTPSSVSIDQIQALSNQGGRGCIAVMTDLIDNCGAGPNRPCLVKAEIVDSGEMEITMAWMPPADSAILYTRDSEEGGSSRFDWEVPADAMEDMIRGWEIFIRESTQGGVEGDGLGWQLVSDEDGMRIDRGDGVYLSTDTQATVRLVVPATGSIRLAVAPVFDGPGSYSIPGDGGYTDGLGVSLDRVVSSSLTVTPPTQESYTNILQFFGWRTLQTTVKLTWQTGQEKGIAGFNLLRSVNGHHWDKLNDTVIPASGVSGDGATYFFNDQPSGSRNGNVYYRLQAITQTEAVVAEAKAVVKSGPR